jgi:hypothetical protein
MCRRPSVTRCWRSRQLAIRLAGGEAKPATKRGCNYGDECGFDPGGGADPDPQRPRRAVDLTDAPLAVQLPGEGTLEPPARVTRASQNVVAAPWVLHEALAVSPEKASDLLASDDALTALATLDSRQSKVLELHSSAA